MRRGEIWWTAVGQTRSAGGRRPMLVIQANEFNDSAIPTVLCAALTSRLQLAAAPGNVQVARRVSGLPQDAVIDVAQLLVVDKRLLTENVGRLPAQMMQAVEAGLRLVLAL